MTRLFTGVSMSHAGQRYSSATKSILTLRTVLDQPVLEPNNTYRVIRGPYPTAPELTRLTKSRTTTRKLPSQRDTGDEKIGLKLPFAMPDAAALAHCPGLTRRGPHTYVRTPRYALRYTGGSGPCEQLPRRVLVGVSAHALHGTEFFFGIHGAWDGRVGFMTCVGQRVCAPGRSVSGRAHKAASCGRSRAGAGSGSREKIIGCSSASLTRGPLFGRFRRGPTGARSAAAADVV